MNELAEMFREFPGIGPRQARRFAYFIMSKPKSFTDEFINKIQEIKKSISYCKSCFRMFVGNDICPVCSQNRENILMVVSRDIDFENIEKSKIYDGYYFILGGTVPILDKNPRERIRIDQLVKKIKQNSFKEIILSLSLTPEGENTESYIKEVLSKETTTPISTLGRGLSTGSELEYADSDTLKYALRNRFI